ncbi:MAG: folylpolyglutamate synthase/dihydrofolate synthase family protein [bacterium]|nr:folylpolyglutamate synthase/dihydrofolate synthase family protein [bacterium]
MSTDTKRAIGNKVFADLFSLSQRRYQRRRPSAWTLHRMEELVDRLGHPEKSFKTIHVGGTSGKGSTATMIASILRASSRRVGLEVFPPVRSMRESVQINGRVVSETCFRRAWTHLQPIVEAMHKESKEGAPTFFEALIALCFLVWKEAKIDVAVVEVGMGGARDATNVIRPEVVVLTNVGLDHTQFLGSTVEAIAREKVGILKEGTPVISAATQESVQAIIKKKAKEEKTTAFFYGKDFHDAPFDLSLLGQHQRINAACAVAAVKIFDSSITQENIQRGLSTVVLPGRFEIVRSRPLVIFDGAHNPDKMTALVQTLKAEFPKKRIIGIFGVKEDKDVEAMFGLFGEELKTVFATTFQIPPIGVGRALSASALTKRLHRMGMKSIITEPNPRRALGYASRLADKNDLILVTGSFYLLLALHS